MPPGRRAREPITPWKSGNRHLRRGSSPMSATTRDGGARVTFTACPFTAEYPEQREGQPPSTRIKVDNVNRELVPQIRAALGVLAIHSGSLSRISRQRSDRAGLWTDRVRIAQCTDGWRVAERHGHGAQPAKQALPAAQSKLRLRPVSEPVAVGRVGSCGPAASSRITAWMAA
jgi:Domain of unknown function (DUF1833)